jgi:predicted dehydrogenase
MNVAIVGAGGMGRAWTEMVLRQEDTDLAAFVDPLIDTRLAPVWLDVHAGITKVPSLATLDVAQEIDAVIVTALSPAHYEVVRAALELGCHVLVEKPFVTTLTEAEHLVKLAVEKQKVLMVSQNYRFFPGVQKVCELVKEGVYGQIRAVVGQFWCDWPGKPYQHEMMHPMGLEMAIHHFDLGRAMFSAEAVSGRVLEWNPAWSPYRMGAALEALFTMRSGDTSFPFLYSGSLIGKAPRTPWGGLWRLEFEGATLVADEIDGRYGVFKATAGGYEILSPFAGETMMLDASFRHFRTCIEEGKEPWSSGRDNLGTLNMALGFNTSTSETSRDVKL